MEDTRLELVEVEVVRLAEELDLPVLLGGENRLRTASEASVVDASDGEVVMGKFKLDL